LEFGLTRAQLNLAQFGLGTCLTLRIGEKFHAIGNYFYRGEGSEKENSTWVHRGKPGFPKLPPENYLKYRFILYLFDFYNNNINLLQ
jgi:hypothetical protein